MQECFAQYPAVYDKSADGTGSADDADLDAALAESAATADGGDSAGGSSRKADTVDQLEEPKEGTAKH